MNKRVIRYFGSGLAILLPATGFSGSWDITQDINLNNTLELLQLNASNSSQTLNYIHLNDTANVANQMVNLNSNAVTLTQTAGSNNTQALNRINSPDVNNSTQTITGVTAFTLNQTDGSNNLQAGNLLENSNDNTGSHTQTINTDTASFTQANARNIQAGNAALDVAGAVTQTFTANSLTADFSDAADGSSSSGENSYQAANYVKQGNNPATTSSYMPPPP